MLYVEYKGKLMCISNSTELVDVEYISFREGAVRNHEVINNTYEHFRAGFHSRDEWVKILETENKALQQRVQDLTR